MSLSIQVILLVFILGRQILLAHIRRRKSVVQDLTSLPVVQHHLSTDLDVGVTSLKQPTGFSGHLVQEIIGISPVLDSVNGLDLVLLNPVQQLRDVEIRVDESLGSHNSLKHDIDLKS